MAVNEPGTKLTCSNDECECELLIEKPCPHGDIYTCACGEEFVPVEK
ncbi:MAG: metallothionein [Actinomycetota bacterium]|nr:metallothionein [Actinomycetota bacterium]